MLDGNGISPEVSASLGPRLASICPPARWKLVGLFTCAPRRFLQLTCRRLKIPSLLVCFFQLDYQRHRSSLATNPHLTCRVRRGALLDCALQAGHILIHAITGRFTCANLTPAN